MSRPDRDKHVAVDVAGLLKFDDRDLDGVLTVDGQPASATKAREALTEALADGITVIPFGAKDACPDFDYTGGGCPGHPVKARREAAE